MKTEIDQLECALFQSQLAELVGSGANPSAHPHLISCPRCRALLADLETIAEAARQLMGSADPPDALWENIESAILRDETETGPASANGLVD